MRVWRLHGVSAWRPWQHRELRGRDRWSHARRCQQADTSEQLVSCPGVLVQSFKFFSQAWRPETRLPTSSNTWPPTDTSWIGLTSTLIAIWFTTGHRSWTRISIQSNRIWARLQVLLVMTNLISELTCLLPTVCNLVCPTSFWDYNAAQCKCSCSVVDCPSPDYTVNNYACNCIPTNNCNLKQIDNCGPLSGSVLLDYDACQCKDVNATATTAAPQTSTT